MRIAVFWRTQEKKKAQSKLKEGAHARKKSGARQTRKS
jgi:hypothetical protein